MDWPTHGPCRLWGLEGGSLAAPIVAEEATFQLERLYFLQLVFLAVVCNHKNIIIIINYREVLIKVLIKGQPYRQHAHLVEEKNIAVMDRFRRSCRQMHLLLFNRWPYYSSRNRRCGSGNTQDFSGTLINCRERRNRIRGGVCSLLW